MDRVKLQNRPIPVYGVFGIFKKAISYNSPVFNDTNNGAIDLTSGAGYRIRVDNYYGKYYANMYHHQIIYIQPNPIYYTTINDENNDTVYQQFGQFAQFAGQSAQFADQSVQFAGQSAQFAGQSVQFAQFADQSVHFAGPSTSQSVQFIQSADPSTSQFADQSVQYAGQSVQFADQSVNFAGPSTSQFADQSIQFAGQSVQFADQSVQSAGQSVYTAGPSTSQSDQSIQSAGPSTSQSDQFIQSADPSTIQSADPSTSQSDQSIQSAGPSTSQSDQSIQSAGPSTSQSDQFIQSAGPSTSQPVQSIQHTQAQVNFMRQEPTYFPRLTSPTISIVPREQRPIIIDGLNIGYAHGCNKTFSTKGIFLCLQYFTNLGFPLVRILLPQHYQGIPGTETHSDISLLFNAGYIYFTPSRKISNIRLTCYSDRIILEHAYSCGGVVVSNDNFRDLYEENEKFKEIIENRHIMIMFINDEIIIPSDQYSHHYPNLYLTNILHFPS